MAVSATCGSPGAVSAQTPAQDGQWSAPFELPLIAIHSALLPSGKVLLFSAEHGVPGIHGWLLDPDSLVLENVPPPPGWNPDCAGHSFLADGRLLVAGGTLQFNPILGPRAAFTFNPLSEAWTRVEDMAAGRWYPTNITLPDGRVVTMSGLNDTNGALNPDIEIWDPAGTSNWLLVGQRTIPYYPYLHVLPSGLVFRSGPDAQTETFDPATAQWAPVATTIFAGRYEAPSVLLPPTLDRVMLIGGYDGIGAPTNSVEIIDTSDPTPQWNSAAHMQFARMEHNAVLLPDGRVLVVGGRSSAASADSVMVPEVFDPGTGTWDSLAPHQVRRMYHATALLLTDGRILVAGGDDRPSGEIYSPPYLFNGPRPVIQSAPIEMYYASSFDLEFSSSTNSNTVALIRMSSVTHSVNMGQRYVLLAQGVPNSGGPVTLPTPATAGLAPPGYYMLFVTNADGVPSESQVVRLDSSPPTTVVPRPRPALDAIGLEQNYPNPFNPVTRISYVVREPGRVSLNVYDPAGRRIITLVDDTQSPGRRTIAWNGRDSRGRLVRSGVYFYTLRSNGETVTRKMSLIK